MSRSSRHDSGLNSGPCVRILLRFRGPLPAATTPERVGTPLEVAASQSAPDLSPAANALEFALVDMVVRAQGGSLALDTSDRNETVLVLDLPS